MPCEVASTDLLPDLLDSKAKHVGIELFRRHGCGNGCLQPIQLCNLALWAPARSSLASWVSSVPWMSMERKHDENRLDEFLLILVWGMLVSKVSFSG